MPTKWEIAKEKATAAIMAAAALEFSEKGYSGATIKAIGTRAGVAYGLICKYFECKENLLRELTREIYLENISVSLDEKSPYKVLCGYIDHARAMLREDPVRFNLNYKLLYDSDIPASIKEDFGQLFSGSSLEKAIKRAQSTGELIKGAPMEIYNLLSRTVYGLLAQYSAMGLSAPGNDSILKIIGYTPKESSLVQGNAAHGFDDISQDERASAARDQILSEVTQALYGFNLTVNLENGEFGLITGTGDMDALSHIKDARNYREAYASMMSRLRPEYQDKLRELLSLDYLRMNSKKIGYHKTEEYQTLGDDETARWEEVNVTIGVNAAGHPVANILGRDITNRRRESALRAQETKAVQSRNEILSDIAQTLYGFNVTVNLAANTYSLITGTGAEQICETLDSFSDKPYTEASDELLSGVPQEYMNEAINALGRDILLGMRHSKGHLGARVFPWHGTDGLDHWYEINIFMGANEKGDPIANLLGRDITAQKEQELQHEQERDAAKAHFHSEIAHSAWGYNLTVNLNTLKYSVIRGTGMETSCELLENSDDYAEALRQKLALVVSKDRPRISAFMAPGSLRKMAADGADGTIATTVYEASVNGDHQWHETSILIGADPDGAPIANIIGRDITEQRALAKTEAQLIASQEANKAKSEFLFNMSHDIRTPMNAIMGFTSIAKKSLDDRKRLVDCLDKIDNSGELMLSLINSVLDMSRLDAGNGIFQETLGSVMNSFSGIETTMQVLAKNKGIALTFGFGNVHDRNVYGDFDRCSRVFVNIISNAIKYSKPNGYVKVMCEQVGPSKNGMAWYRYTFEDNGIGMSNEALGHIFDEFAHKRDLMTGSLQGTDGGLTLCRSFVELMGGSIICQSRQDAGTTFAVTLPFRVLEKEARKNASSIPPESDEITYSADQAWTELAGKRILLVEDNELNREVAVFQLEDNGLEVDAVEDGSIALERVHEKGLDYYDCILMDIQMPIMGGYEATKLIRAEGFTHPIIALSANALPEDRKASLAVGMNAHIAKPIKLKELFSALAKFL